MKKYTQEEIEQLAAKCAETAGSNFMSGMNCCEAVFAAVLDMGLSDLPKETVMVASGLGGGIGGFGTLCGGINGGAMGFGAVRGRKEPLSAGSPKACKDELHDHDHGLYLYTKEYIEAINEKIGTVNCRDIISKYNMADPDQRKAKLAECKGIIEMCAAQSIREICKEI